MGIQLLLNKNRQHAIQTQVLPTFDDACVLVPKTSRDKRLDLQVWQRENEYELHLMFEYIKNYLDAVDSECHVYTYDIDNLESSFVMFMYMHSTNALKK